jgi:peptidoglycan/LPS O-acetylase OafA/YrhL
MFSLAAGTQPPPYRLFGGLRFLLAAMVLLQHGLLLLPLPQRAIFFELELGAVAVTVFLSLSGFVVAEAVSLFYAGRPLPFLANRSLRIVPLYAVALGLTVACDCWFYARGGLVPLDGALEGPPWNPAILLSGALEIFPGLPAHRLSGQEFSFIPYAWTLRVEMAFYLLAALACWLPRQLPVKGAAWCLAYGAFFVFLCRHAQMPRQMLCIPFFAFGVGVYQLEKSRSLAAIANVLALGAGALLAFTYWGQRGQPVLAFQLPLLFALFAVLAWLAGRCASPGRGLFWDKRLGALSYPLYIGHGLTLTVLRNLTDQRNWALYAAGVVGSLALAMALNAAVDRPMRRLRTRVRGAAI